jgi:transposase
VIFVDESGFELLPGRGRTWAPRGQTPVIKAPTSRERVSLIGGLTDTGRVLSRQHTGSVRGADVVRFVKHLLSQVKGKLTVVWDGASIHRSALVRTFLAEPSVAARLEVIRLPAYAPELNPAEGVWRLLKHVHLKNLVCETVEDLRIELRLALARLRHRVSALLGAIRHAGYSV